MESSDDEDAEAEDAERRLPTLAKDQPLTRGRAGRRPGHTHPAAGPLHRGVAGQGAGGAGHRPPVHVRVDHGDHPGPRVRLQARPGADPVVPRVRRGRPAGAALPAAGRLRLHRARWRTSSTRSPVATAAAVDFLTAFYFGGGTGEDGLGRRLRWAEEDGHRATSATSTPGGSTRSRCSATTPGRDVVVRVGRYGPYLQRALPEPGRSPAEEGIGGGDRVSLPEGIAPDELTPEKVAELFLGGGGERKLGEHPETGEPIVLQVRPLRPVRLHRRAQRLAAAVAGAGHACTLDRGAAAALAAPAGRQGRRRATRSSRRPAATGPTSSGATTSGRWTAEDQIFTVDARRGAGAAGRAEDPPAPGRPPRRCARWASTR